MPSDSPRKEAAPRGLLGLRRVPAWGWLLLGAAAGGAAVAALSRRSASAASLMQLVSSAHALVATSGDDARRDESYWQWSNTFGRELRWGAGDGCDASTHLARTSAHALINVESRTQFGTLMDALGATGLGVELGVQRAEFSYGACRRRVGGGGDDHGCRRFVPPPAPPPPPHPPSFHRARVTPGAAQRC